MALISFNSNRGLSILNDSADYWLAGARQLLSPNHDQRPQPVAVSLLVVHNISLPPGEFGGLYVEQLFTNCLDCNAHSAFDDLRDLKVSAHLFIDRNGAITQFVPFNRRAWHAGVSSFQGVAACNDYSIGIELEGDDVTPYTDLQYQTLAHVSRELMAYYPAISVERIVGHCDIAPERKTDPGPAFDWDYFRQQLGV